MSEWFEDELAFIRERRRQYLLSLLWLIPGMLGTVVGVIYHSDWLILGSALAATAIVVPFNIRCEFACRCPRCGKLFFRMGPFHNAFSEKCLHCGLSLNDPTSGGRPS